MFREETECFREGFGYAFREVSGADWIRLRGKGVQRERLKWVN